MGETINFCMTLRLGLAHWPRSTWLIHEHLVVKLTNMASHEQQGDSRRVCRMFCIDDGWPESVGANGSLTQNDVD